VVIIIIVFVVIFIIASVKAVMSLCIYLFVCPSVNLSVSRITQKVVDNFDDCFRVVGHVASN